MDIAVMWSILATITVCVAVILALPKKTLIDIDGLVSPDQVSWAGAITPVVAMWVFIWGMGQGNKAALLVGAISFTLGSSLDLLDGRMARAMLEHDMQMAGGNSGRLAEIEKEALWGKFVDTMADKVKCALTFPVMAYLCWQHGSPLMKMTALAMGAIVVIDVVGGIQKAIAYWMRDVSGVDRNVVGQAKQWLQGALASVWAIAHADIPKDTWTYLLAIVAIAAGMLTLLSPITRAIGVKTA